MVTSTNFWVAGYYFRPSTLLHLLPFQRPQEMPVFAQTYTGMLDTMNFIGESRRAIIFLPYNLAQFGIMIIMF